MTNLRMIAATTGMLTAMALAVVLAACERRQETTAADQTTAAPSQKVADQNPAPQQKAAQKSADANTAQDPDFIPQIALAPSSPGGGLPTTQQSEFARTIINDPDQIAAGKQLFSAMNCVGCHFHGGGGMGPALMDKTWLYGSSIENVASSIREGRPNGMPSFRDHVPEEQIWQLAAYVLSLSKPEQPAGSATGASSGDATPGSN